MFISLKGSDVKIATTILRKLNYKRVQKITSETVKEVLDYCIYVQNAIDNR